MAHTYEVRNTDTSDLRLIFDLFDQSITYQEEKSYPVWRNYDRNAIVKDIENGNQYKIVIDNQTAIVFSACYTDKIIWRHFDRGDALYLHRIVVNPEFKGQQLFGKTLEWAIRHCEQKKLTSIRMDTWAANSNIIEYYKTFGFTIIENYTTPDSTELPVHNRNLELTLLEYKGRILG
jgi:ribosomal protein S18 acetylase RimI-like enzyme